MRHAPSAAAPSVPDVLARGRAAIAWLAGAFACAWGASAPEVAIFPLPSTGNRPQAIIAGGDGNVWATEVQRHGILRVTPAGVITTFAVPGEGVGVLQGIAWGSDGALWFTSREENSIRRLAPDGRFGASYPVPSQATDGNKLTKGGWPRAMARGADGALWFSEMAANKLASITVSGQIREYPVPSPGSAPYGVCWLDGHAWFTESVGNRIGCLDPATGAVREFPLPAPDSLPRDAIAAKDGAVWFSENHGGRIGRVTTAGVLTEFPIPTPGSQPIGIAEAPDGTIWFCEFKPGKIGWMTPTGTMLGEVALDVPDAKPFGICAGPDGNMWVALQANAVARITPPHRE
jgi:virginiamycin B lyase